MYEVGSYALPGRYSHWTFGKTYHRMKTMYDFGPFEDLRSRHQHEPSLWLPAGNQPDSEQDGDRARAWPRRLFQKQFLLLKDQPPHG